jgi:hypothetical protein
MAQIKVGSALVKPKGINVFKDGQWKKKCIGRIFKNGIWNDFIQYIPRIYENGTEYTPMFFWNNGSGEYYRNINHLLLGATVQSNSQVFVATNTTVELTNVSKVNFDVEYVGLSGSSRIDFVVSTAKQTGGAVSTSKTPPTSWTRITVTLDVTTLSGVYYVRNGALSSSLKIYKIWLE